VLCSFVHIQITDRQNVDIKIVDTKLYVDILYLLPLSNIIYFVPVGAPNPSGGPSEGVK
jgi:hypothetical protein